MVTLSVYSLCFVSSVFQRKTLSVPGLDLSAALLQICEPFYSPYPTAMTTDLKKNEKRCREREPAKAELEEQLGRKLSCKPCLAEEKCGDMLAERCIMSDISFICHNHMKAYLT